MTKNKKFLASLSIAVVLSVALTSAAFATIDWFNHSPYAGSPLNGGVTVNTTSTIVLSTNANAQGIILTNSGANPIYLVFGTGNTATVNGGPELVPSGGALVLDGQLDWAGGIEAIASGGTSTLTYTQF